MLNLRKFAIAACAVAGAAVVGGCSDYGYGGVNVGYGAPGYYGGYDDYGYGGAPYGYAGLGSGWYDDYYYPGSGYYVYDRGGRRQRWNDGQRRHWEGRREARANDPTGRDFPRGAFGRGWRDRQGIVTRPVGVDRSAGQADRQAYRAQRQAARETYRAQRGSIDGGQRAARPDGAGRGFRGDGQRGSRGGGGGGRRGAPQQ